MTDVVGVLFVLCLAPKVGRSGLNLAPKPSKEIDKGPNSLENCVSYPSPFSGERDCIFQVHRIFPRSRLLSEGVKFVQVVQVQQFTIALLVSLRRASQSRTSTFKCQDFLHIFAIRHCVYWGWERKLGDLITIPRRRRRNPSESEIGLRTAGLRGRTIVRRPQRAENVKKSIAEQSRK